MQKYRRLIISSESKIHRIQIRIWNIRRIINFDIVLTNSPEQLIR